MKYFICMSLIISCSTFAVEKEENDTNFKRDENKASRSISSITKKNDEKNEENSLTRTNFIKESYGTIPDNELFNKD